MHSIAVTRSALLDVFSRVDVEKDAGPIILGSGIPGRGSPKGARVSLYFQGSWWGSGLEDGGRIQPSPLERLPAIGERVNIREGKSKRSEGVVIAQIPSGLDPREIGRLLHTDLRLFLTPQTVRWSPVKQDRALVLRVDGKIVPVHTKKLFPGNGSGPASILHAHTTSPELREIAILTMRG